MEMDVHGKGKKLRKKILEIEGIEKIDQVHYWKISGKQDAAMVAAKVKENASKKEVYEKCKAIMPHWNTLQLT